MGCESDPFGNEYCVECGELFTLFASTSRGLSSIFVLSGLITSALFARFGSSVD